MDSSIPTERLRYSAVSNQFETVRHANTRAFLKGPVSMDWLGAAANLPGKALHVAVAVQWLAGMNGGKPFKLTAKALRMMNVSSDASGDGIKRLEAAGLITVTRHIGQRHTIAMLPAAQSQ